MTKRAGVMALPPTSRGQQPDDPHPHRCPRTGHHPFPLRPGQADSVVPKGVVSFQHLYNTIVRFSEDESGAKEQLEAWFQDKYVLIGPSAQDVGDRSPLPTVHEAPMMYAHANALDNLLENRFLEEVNTNLVYGLIVALSALTAFLVLATPTGGYTVFVLLVALAVEDGHLVLGKGLVFNVVDVGSRLLSPVRLPAFTDASSLSARRNRWAAALCHYVLDHPTV